MRIAYFQPFSGLSGDMTLGALLDAGLELERLEEELAKLPLSGYRLVEEPVYRGAFATTRLHVVLEEGPDPTSEHREESAAGSHSHEHRHGHPQDHGDSHSHQHSHEHTHSHHHEGGGAEHTHSHAHSGGVERGLGEILALLEASTLDPTVQEMAERVFRRLGEAEAKAHGMPVEEVHFHEVGAVDSIVDIVGSCAALWLLGIDEVQSAPVALGAGWIQVAHGRLALPAPATLELLRGIPVEQRESGFELTTPTGAALLATLATRFGTLPAGRIQAIGYGAGNDRPGPVPNCLRILIAETDEPAALAPKRDRVVLLETNLDDMSPESLAALQEDLLAAGALDVWITPIGMKKSRPGHLLSALAQATEEERLSALILEESTSFGLRRSEHDRLVLDRDFLEVETPGGKVRVKRGRLAGRTLKLAPEFEDLRRAARQSGRPLAEMHSLCLELARQREEPGSS